MMSNLPFDLDLIRKNIRKTLFIGGAVCASLSMVFYILILDRLDTAFTVQIPFGLLFIIAVILIYFLAIVLILYFFDIIREKSETSHFEPLTQLFFLFLLFFLCISFSAVGAMVYLITAV